MVPSRRFMGSRSLVRSIQECDSSLDDICRRRGIVTRLDGTVNNG
jgi:hypothetical protein